MTGHGPLQGDRHELASGDSLYPEALLEAPDRPERLYVLGNPEALARPSVSVIGARKATPYGVACARMAARIAAQMGIQVVSGAAIGCDLSAQAQALESGGDTVAVLGCGANVVYPAEARELLQDILTRGGAIVSARPWDARPAKWAFIRRNAIIAALSAALVICEAGMPSGTFSTARYATDYGKEVLVFPGSVFSPNSTGCNYIVASQPQALPIWDETCLEVAFSRLYGVLRSPRVLQAPRLQSEGAPDFEEAVLAALQASPCPVGDLARTFGRDVLEIARVLARLEVAGRVVRLRDGRYSLSEREYLSHNSYRL